MPQPTIFSTQTQQNLPVQADQPDIGAIVLHPDYLPHIQQQLNKLSFETIPAGQIISIGLEAEKALHQTLDGFLARLDRRTAAQVFALFRRLKKGVADAELDTVLAEIQEGDEPNLLQSITGWFQGKSHEQIVDELMGALGDLIAGKTKSLADEMAGLEKELTQEMQKLFVELQALEKLKDAYGEHFLNFSYQAAVAHAFWVNAKSYVESQAAQVQSNDMIGLGHIQELENKLRLLESRALALEGVYTRLPADQLVIQQIEQAGITTLQETATTISSRFASIKMTLLAIHGAFTVGNVQRISERQAQMDQQLTDLRTKALKQVAVAAAQSPGENRLQQAQQISGIVSATAEISQLIDTAEQETDAKFEEARRLFQQARDDMTNMRNN